MDTLIPWLETNMPLLVEVAVGKLAQTEALRATVSDSAEAFFDGIIRSLKLESPLPLNLILLDWVEARSAPTDEELSGLLPVLSTLKDATWEVLIELVNDKDLLLKWLSQLEALFALGLTYLANLESEALLKDTRAELSLALMDVERLNKNKSDFISVAAHELKTPLTLIEGYTNMLRSEFPEQPSVSAEVMLAGIAGGTKRLREIIQDMIDVSMIEMDLLQLHFQPMWLRRIIELIEADVGNRIRQRNLELVVDKDSFSMNPTYGDPERMYQAISKVVANAVKFTPDGGKVTLKARDLPGFTEIVVEDTGIGIEAEDLQRIFEKFSSLEDVAHHSSSKTKFKGGGPGLGLAIARGIIEAHGGTIWAESPGYSEANLPGSIFHLMVPMRVAPKGHVLQEMFNTEAAEPE